MPAVAVNSDKELDSMPDGVVVRSSCFVVGADVDFH